ncbi:uncharacterized protein NEPG_00230 [Nematocida parisii ERTm1]|uniref:uncharacterized protein n=1 Tax=Nematocida parisii (strain ERTm1 / ATCC PRA-289) TaxID=881290 RepID=UPI000264B41A|nr:uncharacterized protein NEPG_00230 [Nematocida parisii ERTm1]EIJ94707.1 hypothetical protein NEPG_00230 [Nematocida parisii ERTm1]|eukprot:XP_013058063.1 hypothetical protein NEPG_00230 [Nematocida parisii ERTm1]
MRLLFGIVVLFYIARTELVPVYYDQMEYVNPNPVEYVEYSPVEYVEYAPVEYVEYAPVEYVEYAPWGTQTMSRKSMLRKQSQA